MGHLTQALNGFVNGFTTEQGLTYAIMSVVGLLVHIFAVKTYKWVKTPPAPPAPFGRRAEQLLELLNHYRSHWKLVGSDKLVCGDVAIYLDVNGRKPTIIVEQGNRDMQNDLTYHELKAIKEAAEYVQEMLKANKRYLALQKADLALENTLYGLSTPEYEPKLSAKQASGGDPYVGQCDCVPVLVEEDFTIEEMPMAEAVEQMEQMEQAPTEALNTLKQRNAEYWKKFMGDAACKGR